MENPFPKDIEGIVHPFGYPIKQTIRLAVPASDKETNFFDIVHTRKSRRNLGALTDAQIHELLWYSSKVLDLHYQDNGYILSHRPAPSAGARHPIDLLVIHQGRGIAYYNPFEHTLNLLSLDQSVIDSFIKHIAESITINDATLFWFIAQPDRTTAKYGNADSLIWRDAGAYTYCVQLTATALGIGSCAIGTLGKPFIQQLFGSYGAIASVGGLIVGNSLEI
jgi:SagB-type dehydrogenase family enzyme